MDKFSQFLGYPAANLVVPVLLFIVLSPGFLLTLAPKSLQFTVPKLDVTLLIHALVFAVVFFLLRKSFPQFY